MHTKGVLTTPIPAYNNTFWWFYSHLQIATSRASTKASCPKAGSLSKVAAMPYPSPSSGLYIEFQDSIIFFHRKPFNIYQTSIYF
jgi:hypothetical protein